jgi:hypothetical protein
VSSRVGARAPTPLCSPHVWPRPPVLRCQRDQTGLLDPAASTDPEHRAELERGPNRPEVVRYDTASWSRYCFRQAQDPWHRGFTTAFTTDAEEMYEGSRLSWEKSELRSQSSFSGFWHIRRASNGRIFLRVITKRIHANWQLRHSD